MQSGANSRWSDDAGDEDAGEEDETRIELPNLALCFPLIEEQALTTRRAGATMIALTVGVDQQVSQTCADVVGETVRIVASSDIEAACDLLLILRPRLSVIASSLVNEEGERIAAAAAAAGSTLVTIEPTLGIAEIGWLIQRAAVAAFGSAHYVPGGA